MMFVIKNITNHPIPIGNDQMLWVGQQLEFATLTLEMVNALDTKQIEVKSSDETSAERKADVDAINSGIAGMDKILDGKK